MSQLTAEAQAAKDEVIDNNLIWAYDCMFRLLREQTVFDADGVEEALWQRVAALQVKPAEVSAP